jgi:dihydropteroate synthase
MRARDTGPGSRPRGTAPATPVVLPLGDGAWRGPPPRDAAQLAALAALGWQAEAALPDGSWSWRALGPPRPSTSGSHHAHDEDGALAEQFERARAADAAAFPAEPQWLGVLNLTPDSFSDGGALLAADGAPEPDAVLRRAAALLAQGAAALDLGAESTRPGAAEVPADEQLRRLLPAIGALRPLGATLCVDTRSARVAAACLDAGVAWINDVSGLAHDPGMAPLAAARGCRTLLMHLRGTPADMRERTGYRHLLGEVADELAACVRRGLDAGMNREQIVLDPGIGFAKDAAQSRALVARLGALRALGFPLLAGPSRKSFLAGLAAGAAPADRDRLTIGAAALCAAQGAAWLRLHDGSGWEAVRAAAACARAARGEDA